VIALAAFALLASVIPTPHPLPTIRPIPAACAVLSPATVGRAFGRGITALSAQLTGEDGTARTAHLANCVYSYDRAPYPVVLTINLARATGDLPDDAFVLLPGQRHLPGIGRFTTLQVDNSGGGIVTVHDKRFDLTLWTPGFSSAHLLAELARAAVGGHTPDAPKRAAPWPKRTAKRYACEILGPAVTSAILGVTLNASSAADNLCQYAPASSPYRVVATLALEPKPPGTAFDLQRIGDYRETTANAIVSEPELPFGHLVRPARLPGLSLFFDAGTTLVTVTTPDSTDRALLARLASAVRARFSGSRS
jgi:hypothetical protein